MSLESARGHAKNARNKLRSMQVLLRQDEPPDEEDVDYALDEVLAAIEEIEKSDE